MSNVERSHYVETIKFLLTPSVADPLVELDELKWRRKIRILSSGFIFERILLRRPFILLSSSEARVSL